jgi:hypothetical protein
MSSDQGFQPLGNSGFTPVPSGAFPPTSTTQKGPLDVDAITAFLRGSSLAFPVGFEQGYAQGLAKGSGTSQTSGFSQLGFMDTKESSAYGQGYAQGYSQGFAQGYAQGFARSSSGAPFTQGGFQPTMS